jgi:multidrug resistance efflux pump
MSTKETHSDNASIEKVNTKTAKYFIHNEGRKVNRWIYLVMLVVVATFFLPWTQNIRGRGKLTSLNPSQRPQTIHSVIAGRIEKWFVGEGDLVGKGDTIMFITEIKDEYFDPNLLENTMEQITSKEGSVKAYTEKINALDSQIDALLTNQDIKLQQGRNKLKQAFLKIQTDSIELITARQNLKIAEEQLIRYEELLAKDLISKTELESRKVSKQNATAKAIDSENKLLVARNELLNVRAELQGIESDYRDKIAKAESEKFASMSSMFDAEAQVSKLQTQYANYDVRSGYYYITAPQDGYITKAVNSGLGETIKAGDPIVSVMPAKYDLAVEMQIEPMDLPLISVGAGVRFIFDGWPAFVFSGWPDAFYGTFAGKVYAIDNFTGPDGKYRALVVPDSSDHPWPTALRVGTGAEGIALLNEVPVWYELWRNFNGFPPNFYKPKAADAEKK